MSQVNEQIPIVSAAQSRALRQLCISREFRWDIDALSAPITTQHCRLPVNGGRRTAAAGVWVAALRH